MITLDPVLLVLSVAMGFLAGLVSVPAVVDLWMTPVKGREQRASQQAVARLTKLLEALKGMVGVLLGWALALWLGGDAEVTRAAVQYWPESASLLGVLAAHYYQAVSTTERLRGTESLGVAFGGTLLVMPLLIPVGLVAGLVGVGLFWLWRGFRDAVPGLMVLTLALPPAAWYLYHLPGAVVMSALALIAWLVHARTFGQLLVARYGMHPDFARKQDIHLHANAHRMVGGRHQTPDDVYEEQMIQREGYIL